MRKAELEAESRRNTIRVVLGLLLGYVLFLLAISELRDAQKHKSDHLQRLDSSEAFDFLETNVNRIELPRSKGAALPHASTTDYAVFPGMLNPAFRVVSYMSRWLGENRALASILQQTHDAARSSAITVVDNVARVVPQEALAHTATAVHRMMAASSQVLQRAETIRSQLVRPEGRRQLGAELNDHPASMVATITLAFTLLWAGVLLGTVLCHGAFAVCEGMYKQQQERSEQRQLKNIQDAARLAGIDEQTYALLLMEEGRLWVRQRIAGRKLARSVRQFLSVAAHTITCGFIPFSALGYQKASHNNTNMDLQQPLYYYDFLRPNSSESSEQEAPDFDPSFYEAHPDLDRNREPTTFAAACYSW
mmetsp:Transcript_6379/g.17049  ORF Transcript_6379/g.17049 Transcript_6379/m.17049 type:complete len:364 (-) Transcript_6379:2425-3516(-)